MLKIVDTIVQTVLVVVVQVWALLRSLVGADRMVFRRLEVVVHAEWLHLVVLDMVLHMVLSRVVAEYYQVLVARVMQDFVGREHMVAVVDMADMLGMLDSLHLVHALLVVLHYMVVDHRVLVVYNLVLIRTQPVEATGFLVVG